MTEALTLYCANHPNRETALRCNRCEKPICSSCAIRMPTGYRCVDCVRGQQKVFETAVWYDYVLAFAIAGFLSFLGSLLISFIGLMGFFGFFTLLIAPAAGVAVAEAVRFAIRRRRAKRLFQTAAAGALLGSVPLVLIYLLPFIGFLLAGTGLDSLGILFSVIWQVIYASLVTSSTYYRLSGIRLK